MRRVAPSVGGKFHVDATIVAGQGGQSYACVMTSTVSQRAAVGPRWSFGDKLRKIRREVAGVSQAKMAEILEVNAATYSAWEGGRSKPYPRLAEAVALRIEGRFAGRVSAAWVLDYQPTRSGAEPSYLSLVGDQDSETEELLPRMDSNHQPSGDCSHAVCDDFHTDLINVARVTYGMYLKPTFLDSARPWTQSGVSDAPVFRLGGKQTYRNLGVYCA